MIELLLSASLIGILSTALATTSFSIAPITSRVDDNLDITRDIGRIRDLVSNDFETFALLDDTSDALTQLPGSNAFTLSMDSVGSPPLEPDTTTISYRYVPFDESWHLVRFELDSPRSTESAAEKTVVSTHLPPPPNGWVVGDPIPHALTVATIESSTGVTRTATITFSNGSKVSTSGSIQILAEVPETDVEPVDPPLGKIRCGGSITIVFNTSSTTWSQGAASTVTGDLSAFVSSLIGTPTQIRFVAFERSAYSFYPDTSVGTYVDLLTPSTSITALLNRLSTLSTTSSSWRNGRNWEDGIWQATKRDSGTILPQLPDLIIFLTDGQPNRNRTNTTTDTDTTFNTADLTLAVAAAEQARLSGAMLMGILLGTGADTTAAGYLTSVFGPLSWDGSMNVLAIDRARTFSRPQGEGFNRLDEILALAGQWRCGGTITLQQRILSGGTSALPSTSWAFETTASDSPLVAQTSVDQSRPSSTIDFGASDSNQQRLITITQTPLSGHRHHSVSCTSSGVAVPTQTTIEPSGRTVIQLSASPRGPVSCILTAEPMP